MEAGRYTAVQALGDIVKASLLWALLFSRRHGKTGLEQVREQREDAN